ncbi:Uncharacterised protein [Vibrio cholerae]|nr:Uncharacterised protein [Vibrio cholerae]
MSLAISLGFKRCGVSGRDFSVTDPFRFLKLPFLKLPLLRL